MPTATSSLLGVLILVVIVIVIYMKATNKTLTELIKAIKEGFK